MSAPTSSQSYLALDIVTAAQLSPEDPVMISARNILYASLTTPGWTGRVDGQCAEYGRAPSSDSADAAPLTD